MPWPERRTWLELGRAKPVRPPHAIAESAFVDACTRCDACIAACPEQLIGRGRGGYPQLAFDRDGCSFCAACLDACPTAALDATNARRWSWRITLADRCLGARGVVCRSCGDACDARALRFSYGRNGPPRIDAEACTGCGRCIATCPVDALSLAEREAVA